jgi:hypothetical protein
VRIVQLDIDAEEFAGVEAISLVEFPAIELNFLKFKKASPKARVTMAQVDTERRLVVGPAMVPNKLIYRVDEKTGEEYHVYFTRETVRKAAYEYLKANRQHNATVEHEVSVQGVTLVESWIVEGAHDKALHLGYDVPPGTWMAALRVDNDDVWELVKEGAVKGFSIEGWFMERMAAHAMGREELESFTDYPDGAVANAKRGIELNERQGNKCATQTGKVRAQQIANREPISYETVKRIASYLARAEEDYDPNATTTCGTISYLLWGGKAMRRWADSIIKQRDNMNLVEKIKARLSRAKFETAELAEGQGTVTNGKEEPMAIGDPVFVITPEGEELPVPDGEYTLADGRMVTVAEGVISELVAPEAPAEEEATTEEEMGSDLAAKLDGIVARLDALEARASETQEATELLAEELSAARKQPETKPVAMKARPVNDTTQRGPRHDAKAAAARNIEKYA